MTTKLNRFSLREKRPGQSILTRDDIKRAVFVDYEGSKNNPPTLLGYMIDGDVNAAIVEPCFYDCRERYKAKHAIGADHLAIVCASAWLVNAQRGGQFIRILIRIKRACSPDLPDVCTIGAIQKVKHECMPEFWYVNWQYRGESSYLS